MRMTKKEYLYLLKHWREGETLHQTAERLEHDPASFGQVKPATSGPSKFLKRLNMCQIEDRTFRTAAEAVKVLAQEGRIKMPPWESWSGYAWLKKQGVAFQRVQA